MPNVYQNALSDNFQRWERRLDHQRWMNHMRDDMQGLEQPFLDPVDTLTGGIMALPRGIGNALADMAIDTGIGFAMDYGMGDATPAVLSGKKGINKLAKNVGRIDGGEALSVDDYWYHGTPYTSRSGISEFDNALAGSNTGAKSAGKGVFLARKPETAAAYIGEDTVIPSDSFSRFDEITSEIEKIRRNLEAKYPEGENLAHLKRRRDPLQKEISKLIRERSSLPRETLTTGAIYRVNPNVENPYVFDAGNMDYTEGLINRAIKEGVDNGHDGVIIKNIYDGPDGVKDDIMIVFDPSKAKIKGY